LLYIVLHFLFALILFTVEEMLEALLHNYEKHNLLFKLIIHLNCRFIYQNFKPNKLMNCDKLSYATKQC